VKTVAYKNAPPGEESKIRGPTVDLVDKESATESGGRGFNLTEMTSDFDHTDPDEYEEGNPPIEESKGQSLNKEVFDLLVLLGDGLDASGEESLANFADFLIKKFAEVEETNYTELFNSLTIKINNADIVNTNEILKKITKIYSRTLILEHMKNNDIERAKESAYKKALHRADQYLSEG